MMEPRPSLPQPDEIERQAAVLILLSPISHHFPSQLEDLYVTLIRRSNGSRHAHELAFPGGLREPNESLVETALREAKEEIGLGTVPVEVLGSLTPVATVKSRTSILPVLALARTYPELCPNCEVSKIIHMPLKALSRREARSVKVVDDPQVGRRVIPWYVVGKEQLWGASAKIMAELLAIVYGEQYLTD